MKWAGAALLVVLAIQTFGQARDDGDAGTRVVGVVLILVALVAAAFALDADGIPDIARIVGFD